MLDAVRPGARVYGVLQMSPSFRGSYNIDDPPAIYRAILLRSSVKSGMMAVYSAAMLSEEQRHARRRSLSARNEALFFF